MQLVKEPHTAIIAGKTNSGKTYIVLRLLETYYRGWFDDILIICPTIQRNKTYTDCKWIKKDDYVGIENNASKLMELLEEKIKKNPLYNKLLIILDDVAIGYDLAKRDTALSKLAYSGRHSNITTWILSQRYLSVAKNVRENIAQLICTGVKDRMCFKQMIEENGVYITNDEIENIKNDIKLNKILIINADTNTYKTIHDVEELM